MIKPSQFCKQVSSLITPLFVNIREIANLPDESHDFDNKLFSFKTHPRFLPEHHRPVRLVVALRAHPDVHVEQLGPELDHPDDVAVVQRVRRRHPDVALEGVPTDIVAWARVELREGGFLTVGYLRRLFALDQGPYL